MNTYFFYSYFRHWSLIKVEQGGLKYRLSGYRRVFELNFKGTPLSEQSQGMSQKTAFECPFLSIVSWRSLLWERIKFLCYIKENKAIAPFTKESVVNLYCVLSKERPFANEKQWQKPYFRTKITQVPQHKQFHILWPS